MPDRSHDNAPAHHLPTSGDPETPLKVTRYRPLARCPAGPFGYLSRQCLPMPTTGRREP